jgi:hypothetical protein
MTEAASGAKSSDQEWALFNKTAFGLVWCYEQTGTLDAMYDETGACETKGSIWSNISENQTIRPRITKTTSPSERTIAEYGNVTFVHQNQQCMFSFELISDHESARVEVDGSVNCSGKK